MESALGNALSCNTAASFDGNSNGPSDRMAPVSAIGTDVAHLRDRTRTRLTGIEVDEELTVDKAADDGHPGSG